MKNNAKPWRCPFHPNAQIKHTWDEDHYVLNGEVIKTTIPNTKRNHLYQCEQCGFQEPLPQGEGITQAAESGEHQAP